MSVRSLSVELPIVRSPTARRLLMASLVLGLGMGLLVVFALAPSDTGAAVRGEARGVKEGGTLVIGVCCFPAIDPALAPDPTLVTVAAPGTIWAALDASCAMLLRYPDVPPSGHDYSLVPEVATGYPEVSADGMTYTFTVRKGYRFSTGAPVTAQSYAREINRVLNPAMRSPAAKYLQEVVGWDAVQNGAARTASGVKVAGDRLIIRLTKSVPDFPARMTMPHFCPVPSDLPIAPEGVPAPLPGSGPYYIAEFVADSRVLLKRNSYYRGPRPHHLDQLLYQAGVDPQTRTSGVEAGTMDVAFGPARSREADLAAKYGVNATKPGRTRFFSVISPDMLYLAMNTDQPLFRNNPKLRQAVNFALDRRALLRSFGSDLSGSVTDDYLPPGLPGYLDANLYPLDHPDLAKAQALARGHTKSGKAVMYTCVHIAFNCEAVSQVVQQDLKAIGIDVEIQAFPVELWAQKMSTRGEPFDLVVDRLIVPWVDPYQYVNRLFDGRMIQATGNTDISYFNSPHYNRLIDQAGALSGSARYAAYGRLAVDIAKNAAPMAAMFTRNRTFLISSRVGCVSITAHDLDLAGLCLT